MSGCYEKVFLEADFLHADENLDSIQYAFLGSLSVIPVAYHCCFLYRYEAEKD